MKEVSGSSEMRAIIGLHKAIEMVVDTMLERLVRRVELLYLYKWKFL